MCVSVCLGESERDNSSHLTGSHGRLTAHTIPTTGPDTQPAWFSESVTFCSLWPPGGTCVTTGTCTDMPPTPRTHRRHPSHSGCCAPCGYGHMCGGVCPPSPYHTEQRPHPTHPLCSLCLPASRLIFKTRNETQSFFSPDAQGQSGPLCAGSGPCREKTTLPLIPGAAPCFHAVSPGGSITIHR